MAESFESFLDQCEWQLALLNTNELLLAFLRKNILKLWKGCCIATKNCNSPENLDEDLVPFARRLISMFSLLYQKLNNDLKTVDENLFFELYDEGISWGIFPVGVLFLNSMFLKIFNGTTDLKERSDIAIRFLRKSVGISHLGLELESDPVKTMFRSYSFSWFVIVIDFVYPESLLLERHVSEFVNTRKEDWLVASDLVSVLMLYPWPGLSPSYDLEVMKPLVTAVQKKITSSASLEVTKKKLLVWWYELIANENSNTLYPKRFILTPIFLGSCVSSTESGAFCMDNLKRRVNENIWKDDALLLQTLTKWYVGSDVDGSNSISRGRTCLSVAMKSQMVTWFQKFSHWPDEPVIKVIKDFEPKLYNLKDLDKASSLWLASVLDFVANQLRVGLVKDLATKLISDAFESISSIPVSVLDALYKLSYSYLVVFGSLPNANIVDAFMKHFSLDPIFCSSSRYFSLSLEKSLSMIKSLQDPTDLADSAIKLFQTNENVGVRKTCFLIVSRLFPGRLETLNMAMQILSLKTAPLDFKNDVWSGYLNCQAKEIKGILVSFKPSESSILPFIYTCLLSYCETEESLALIPPWIKVDSCSVFDDFSPLLFASRLYSNGLFGPLQNNIDSSVRMGWFSVFESIINDTKWRSGFTERQKLHFAHWIILCLLISSPSNNESRVSLCESLTNAILEKSYGTNQLRICLIYCIFLCGKSKNTNDLARMGSSLDNQLLKSFLNSTEPVGNEKFDFSLDWEISNLIVIKTRSELPIKNDDNVVAYMDHWVESDDEWWQRWEARWKRIHEKKKAESSGKDVKTVDIWDHDGLLFQLFGSLFDKFYTSYYGWHHHLEISMKETNFSAFRLERVLKWIIEDLEKGARRSLKEILGFLCDLSLQMTKQATSSIFADQVQKAWKAIHLKICSDIVFNPSFPIKEASESKLIAQVLYLMNFVSYFASYQIPYEASNLGGNNNGSGSFIISPTGSHDSLQGVADVLMRLSYAIKKDYTIFPTLFLLSFQEKALSEIPVVIEIDSPSSLHCSYLKSTTMVTSLKWCITMEEKKIIVCLLYPLLFDPHPFVRGASKSIFSNVFGGSGAVTSETERYFSDLLSALATGLDHGSWRIRERSALGLGDLIITHGRNDKKKQLSQNHNLLFSIWQSCLSLLAHDDKNTVREAAEKVCVILIPIFVKWIRSGAYNQEFIENVLDFLQRLVLESEKLRNWALQGLSKVIDTDVEEEADEEMDTAKKDQENTSFVEIIRSYAPRIILTLVEAASSIEPEALSYIRFHVERETSAAHANTFDSMRVQSALTSSLTNLVEKWIKWLVKRQITNPDETLLSGLEDLVSRGVGLATQASTSHAIALYLNLCQESGTQVRVTFTGLLKSLLYRYCGANNSGRSSSVMDLDAVAIISVFPLLDGRERERLINTQMSKGWMMEQILVAGSLDEMVLWCKRYILIMSKIVARGGDYDEKSLICPLLLGSHAPIDMFLKSINNGDLQQQQQQQVDPSLANLKNTFQATFDHFVTMSLSDLLTDHYEELINYLCQIIIQARYLPIKGLASYCLAFVIEKCLSQARAEEERVKTPEFYRLTKDHLVGCFKQSKAMWKGKEKLITCLAVFCSHSIKHQLLPIESDWQSELLPLFLTQFDRISKSPELVNTTLIPSVRLIHSSCLDVSKDLCRQFVSDLGSKVKELQTSANTNGMQLEDHESYEEKVSRNTVISALENLDHLVTSLSI